MSRIEDGIIDKEMKGGKKEGCHLGSGEEVALFCLMLYQAIFKGKQVWD